MESKYKKHLQKVMDVLLTIEGAVLLISGIAACDDWIYLIPYIMAAVVILYTDLWKRRWKLDFE